MFIIAAVVAVFDDCTVRNAAKLTCYLPEIVAVIQEAVWTAGVRMDSVVDGAVAPTPWSTGARAPTFTNGWARGHRE